MKFGARLALGGGLCLSCVPRETQPRPAVVWADGEAASEPKPRDVRSGARSTAPQEPYVPRLLCRDGSLSPDCSRASMRGDCCVNQGGVHRDAWGNLIFE